MTMQRLVRAAALAAAVHAAGPAAAGVIVAGTFAGLAGAPVTITLGSTEALTDLIALDPILEFTSPILPIPVGAMTPDPVVPGSALAPDAFVDSSFDVFRPFVDPGLAGTLGVGGIVTWHLEILPATPPGSYPFQVSLVGHFLIGGNESDQLLGAANGAVTVAVPEPSTWALLACGLLLLGLTAMRRPVRRR